MNTKSQPDFSFEDKLLMSGHSLIAGVDEAGRGPWAGPVVAAAVILNPLDIPRGLNDSKKLSSLKREGLFNALKEKTKIGIGIIDVQDIDKTNILQASLLAMKKAVIALPVQPTYALIDGNKCPDLPISCEAVIKGDGQVLSIAAASIIAKVTRDRLMQELDVKFPGYGWKRNMGYGTKEHQSGLARLGVTPHHRRSFAPIKKLITSE